MPNMQNIGLALSGFGAGLTGQGPQFQRNQMLQKKLDVEEVDRKRLLAAERQRTLFTDAKGALRMAKAGRFDQAAQLFGNRLNDLQSFPDADPKDTQRMLGMATRASSGDTIEARALIKELEDGVSVGKAYGLVDEDAPAAVREWEYFDSLSTPDQSRFLEMKRAQQLIDMGGGLQGRVTGGGVEAITGGPDQTGGEVRIDYGTSEAQLEGWKSAAKETGKLQSQFKLAPKVEAAVKAAVFQVTAASEGAEEALAGNRTLEVYDIAMNGLVTALGGTVTGPVAGWLPSLTENQQIAGGAVAAMAPVLKQIFRSAGEGVFTDKDQEMLIEMIPTRTDKAGSRVWKIQNIDNIVRAKLGAPMKTRDMSGAGGTQEGQGDVKFLGFE